MSSRLIAVALVALAACADVDEAPDTETDNVDLAVTEQALVNGCWRHIVIQPKATGLSPSPYSTGRIWDLATAGGTAGCVYQSTGYDFLYSSPYPGGCAQYNASTWYCSGAGTVTCPASASLNRPTEGSDSPFGPFAPFGRYHTSYHSSVVLPFSHSYWDSTAKKVVCGYNTVYRTYKYVPNHF